MCPSLYPFSLLLKRENHLKKMWCWWKKSHSYDEILISVYRWSPHSFVSLRYACSSVRRLPPSCVLDWVDWCSLLNNQPISGEVFYFVQAAICAESPKGKKICATFPTTERRVSRSFAAYLSRWIGDRGPPLLPVVNTTDSIAMGSSELA